MLPQILISASAALVLFAGAMHLRATFYGPDLRPQDQALEARMKEASPNLTNQITMWNAWIGFNAILSLGLMLFGLLYGYLALRQFAVLRESPFLLAVGFAFLASSTLIWKRYTFHPPVLLFTLSLVLYVAGVAIALI